MMTITATFDLTILYFVAANVIAILAYVFVLKRRARRTRERIATITASVRTFFGGSGNAVTVHGTTHPEGKGYVVFINTGSSQRFRHSHIVEMILIDYVRAKCGLDLKQVFWRFPIRDEAAHGPQASSVEAARVEAVAAGVDDYLAQGLKSLRDLPGYEVSETSFEAYQAFALRGAADGGGPARAASWVSEVAGDAVGAAPLPA